MCNANYLIDVAESAFPELIRLAEFACCFGDAVKAEQGELRALPTLIVVDEHGRDHGLRLSSSPNPQPGQ